MLFRSFLQVIALVLFGLVFLLVALILAAYIGYLGPEAHQWVEWGWNEGIAHQGLIQKAFAIIGATATLTISAAGVYKSWHFHELNLPARLEELSKRWRKAIIRDRRDAIPELCLVDSISSLSVGQRSWFSRVASLIYDSEQTALLNCSRKLEKLEAELTALVESHKRCQAEVLTTYLELGSRMRVCDPDNGQAALNFFKKPLDDLAMQQLEARREDWDALELAGRQALTIGMRQQAGGYIVRLIHATEARHALRHARALRFYAEILHEGSPNERSLARSRLDRAISVLQNSDVGDPAARGCELGLAYEMLVKVQISRGRFHSARTALREAKRHLGNLDRLKDLEDRATPKG